MVVSTGSVCAFRSNALVKVHCARASIKWLTSLNRNFETNVVKNKLHGPVASYIYRAKAVSNVYVCLNRMLYSVIHYYTV